MRPETTSTSSLPRIATTLALGIALALGVSSAAHASDDPPPAAHDACGPDGGVFLGGDAGVGDYVFSDPVAAPVQGARWEPACSASPASAGSSAFASLLGLAALGLVTRRRTR